MIKRTFVACWALCLAPLLGAQGDGPMLRIGLEADLGSPAPWDSVWTYNGKLLSNVLEPLLALEPTGVHVQPLLARSWRATEGNRVFFLTLREGVRFHDGSTLSAADVVASARLFRGLDARVEPAGPLAVRFTLAAPNSNFLNTLTHGRYGIASRASVERFEELRGQERLAEYVPVGTGPFRFGAWEQGRRVVMRAYPGYWQGPPSLGGLEYRVITDNKERLRALETGEIDLLDVILPADLKRIEQNPDLAVQSLFGMNVCFLGLNTTLSPTSDLRVRRALTLAIDKLDLVRRFYHGGYGVPTERVLSPAFWGMRGMPSPGSHNPERARQLLAEAGHGRGLALRMTHVNLARPYLPDPWGVADAIKAQLARIGVTVELTTDGGPVHLNLQGWVNVSGDPDYTFGSLFNGWRSQPVAQALRSARELPIEDVAGRIRLYNEAERLMQEEAPIIPLTHTKVFMIHRRKVKGLVLFPSSYISYRSATLAQ